MPSSLSTCSQPSEHHCILCANSQVGFRRELIKEVRAFVVDAQAFRKDWEAHGPMVPGLDPMEAVDRLKKFQQMFEVGLFLLSSTNNCPVWM